MSNQCPLQPDPSQPMVYQIRLKGHLGSQWTDWFDGMSISREANGETLLTGRVVDQAALYGLLKKVRDLGMPLLSINQTLADETPQPLFDKEKLMHTDRPIHAVEDKKAKLSTLWIFIMFNMAFADIFSFMYPGVLQQILTGNADGITITPEFLLIAAVVTEISIAMVFLSRLLKQGINRWTNIIAAGITILWVIGGGSNTLHYIFFASIEVACSLVIIWQAWKWHSSEDQAYREAAAQTR